MDENFYIHAADAIYLTAALVAGEEGPLYVNEVTEVYKKIDWEKSLQADKENQFDIWDRQKELLTQQIILKKAMELHQQNDPEFKIMADGTPMPDIMRGLLQETAKRPLIVYADSVCDTFALQPQKKEDYSLGNPYNYMARYYELIETQAGPSPRTAGEFAQNTRIVTGIEKRLSAVGGKVSFLLNP